MISFIFYFFLDYPSSNKPTMVFQQYDKWRSHPIFYFRGWKDLRHLVPGFGIAAGVFVVYLSYKTIVEPTFSHDDHDHHHGPVIIKGASHAREIQQGGSAHHH